jgi:hypothetical protein
MSRIVFASALIIAGTVQCQQYPVAGVVLPPTPPDATDPDHISASAAKASLESSNGKQYVPFREVQVGRQGTFLFDNVLQGRYRVVATDANLEGYLPGCKELHAPLKSGNLAVYLTRAVPFDEDHKIYGPAVGKLAKIIPHYCSGDGPPYFATVGSDGVAHFKGLRLTGRAEQKDYSIQLVPPPAPRPTTDEEMLEVGGPGASDQPSPQTIRDSQQEHPQETDQPKVLTKPVDTSIQKLDSSFIHPRVDAINQEKWIYDPEKKILIPVGMTVEQKLVLHLQHTFDPSAFFFAAVVGAFNQARNDPPEWGGGVAGYGERVASAYGYHSVVQNTLSFIVDSALHLDPRYYRSTRRGAWQRLSDCLEQTVLTRTDSGSRTFNYWRFAGAYGAGFVSNAWVPSPISTAPRAIIRGSVSIGLDTGANVAREFLPEMKRILLNQMTAARNGQKHPALAAPPPSK